MFVPSYQMHNVLNVFRKQLRHNIISDKKKITPEKLRAEQVSLAPEVKRQATIEKVSNDIIEKITRFGSQTRSDQEPTERAKEGVEKENAAGDAKETTFVFNVIDTINQKTRNTLSVEDSSFLIKRLEQLSKEAGDKKMDSWV